MKTISFIYSNSRLGFHVEEINPLFFDSENHSVNGCQLARNQLACSKFAGRAEKYGPRNSPITACVLTERFKCLSRLQRSGRFRVRKNFAFVFCGRKAFGGNIIKPGHLIRFVPFPFCYTPKQLQPAEGRF